MYGLTGFGSSLAGFGKNNIPNIQSIPTPLLWVPNPQGSGGDETDESSLMKNLLINGDMLVSQRFVSTVVTPSATVKTYTLDRWALKTAGGLVTAQQIASTLPGFINSIKLTAGMAAAPSAGSDNVFQQFIEGLNIGNLAWGGTSARAVSLVFSVVASVAGTYGFSLRNSARNRSYVGQFTLAANVPNTVTIANIPGDVTGTWLLTNGVGIEFSIDLGSGTNFEGVQGWQTGNKSRLAGMVNFTNNTGATLELTGFQLVQTTNNAAADATFEFLSMAVKIALCCRYYWKSFPQGTVVGTNKNNAGTIQYIASIGGTTTGGGVQVKFSVPMRDVPAMVAYSQASNNATWQNSGGTDSGVASFFQASDGGFFIQNPQVIGDAAGALFRIAASADAEL